MSVIRCFDPIYDEMYCRPDFSDNYGFTCYDGEEEVC